MTVMMSALLTTYSCSSDDDEPEPVYPKVSDSKYYMDPEWDESIIYLRPKDFREKKFFPGVRVVEQLVDYPAYVTYRTISGDGMDICFVTNVDNKLEPTTRTEFYDGEGAMATVLEWDYIDLIRRYRMTVNADDFFKFDQRFYAFVNRRNPGLDVFAVSTDCIVKISAVPIGDCAQSGQNGRVVF